MNNYLVFLKLCFYLFLLSIMPAVIWMSWKITNMYLGYKISNYKKFNNIKFFKLISDKGFYGEYLTFKKLEKQYPNSILLANVYIPNNDKTTEIDLLMVHDTGIYVFESKNYSGWVFGQENDKKWTVSLNRKIKNQILNPIIQNKIHINALMNLLELEDTYFNNIIVFSERCKLKKVKTKTLVVKRNDLIDELEKVVSNKDNIIDKNKIEDIRNELSQYCNVSEEIKLKHINDIKANINR